MLSQGLKTHGQIIAPNVNRDWSPEDVFNTGFLDDFSQELGIIAVEKYATTCPNIPHPGSEPSRLGIQPTTVLPSSITVGTAFTSLRRPLTAKNTGVIHQPQDVLPMFLTHDTGVNVVRQYLNTAMIAQQLGKPFMMFETNTASCGGFPGVSDAFAAALWGLDYGLAMAYGNFTGALLHFGGQSVYYNPFTPPPSNQTAFHQWTVGMYDQLVSLRCC